MINLKNLRKIIENQVILAEELYKDDNGKLVPWPRLGNRITIKRKKKMALIKTANGVKTKRVNYIKIEIIE